MTMFTIGLQTQYRLHFTPMSHRKSIYTFNVSVNPYLDCFIYIKTSLSQRNFLRCLSQDIKSGFFKNPPDFANYRQ